MRNGYHKYLLVKQVITLRTKIVFWQSRAQSYYCVAGPSLFFAKRRYYLLCFKHFGWRRAAAFLLKTAEQMKAVGLALFTHPRNFPNSSVLTLRLAQSFHK